MRVGLGCRDRTATRSHLVLGLRLGFGHQRVTPRVGVKDWIRIRIGAYTHTRIHIHIRTHAHTYTYRHTHMHAYTYKIHIDNIRIVRVRVRVRVRLPWADCGVSHLGLGLG